jgi:DNA repair exonuclease SbcCD ATPase subunit
LEGDNARLRALTEVDEPAGVGLACRGLRQQAIDARSAHDQALREVSDLRSRLAETDKLRVQAEEQLDSLKSELEKVREISSTEMTELRRQHEVERTHLQHDHEQLRGRMVRRLNDGAEMLEVGLTALRNKTPRVEVMLERAEHVVETLRSEIKNLREE